MMIDERVRRVWQFLTRTDYVPSASHKATAIRVPVWALIHRFIAYAFFPRTDGGRFVSRVELVLMSYMMDRTPVDWLEALTKGFEAHLAASCRNKSLGGGSFLTILAQKLYFDLSESELLMDSLSLAGMQSRHIVTKDFRWTRTLPAEGVAEPGEGEDHDDDAPDVEMTDAPLAPPPPAFTQPPPSDIPSSSTQPPPPPATEKRLDLIMTWLATISGRQQEIRANQQEIRADQQVIRADQWEIRASQCEIMDVLGAITSHLGIPIHPPITAPPTAPPTVPQPVASPTHTPPRDSPIHSPLPTSETCEPPVMAIIPYSAPHSDPVPDTADDAVIQHFISDVLSLGISIQDIDDACAVEQVESPETETALPVPHDLSTEEEESADTAVGDYVVESAVEEGDAAKEGDASEESGSSEESEGSVGVAEGTQPPDAIRRGRRQRLQWTKYPSEEYLTT